MGNDFLIASVVIRPWTPGNLLKFNMVAVEVLPQYGYVLLVAIASIFLIFWQGMKVGLMRKQCKVEYPTMYSKDNNLFNCYQRAHQNTLENYPQFLILLLIGG